MFIHDIFRDTNYCAQPISLLVKAVVVYRVVSFLINMYKYVRLILGGLVVDARRFHVLLVSLLIRIRVLKRHS